MFKIYQDAITLFGIEQGFIEEQIDQIYKKKLEDFKCLSCDKKSEIEIAYQSLKESFPHYIVNPNSTSIKKEQMIEDLSKLIYDYGKNKRSVDKYFIAHLVETLVSYYQLHSYVKDIEFCLASESTIAGYTKAQTIRIYECNLKNAFSYFYETKKGKNTYFPYYRTTISIRHEIEHANQKKERQEKIDDVRTFLFRACNDYKQKNDASFERIVGLPEPIFILLNKLLQEKLDKNYKKYHQNWLYSPEERMADICASFLVLALIEQAKNKKELEDLKEYFTGQIMDFLFFGYDRLFGPTNFYLSKFRQYKDCIELLKMSKTVSLEERLLLGLYLNKKEQKEVEKKKEKIFESVYHRLY